MLLTLDVGNTNIVLGVFDGELLQADWRVRTDRERTTDEHGLLIMHLLESKGLHKGDLDGFILSSVVPTMTETLAKVARNYFDIDPVVIGPETDFGLKALYHNPSEIGADRLVNAVAVKQKYGGPAIVVDFGTATTFDALTAEGDYLGGAIAPGIGISSNALFQAASRLYRVELIAPQHAIGRSTMEAMQSGIIFGFAGQVDALVKRIRNELGEDAPAIATGGLATLISKECETIRIVDEMLTLNGLKILWHRNHFNKKFA